MVLHYKKEFTHKEKELTHKVLTGHIRDKVKILIGKEVF